MGSSVLQQRLEANRASTKSDASDILYRHCKNACPILVLRHMLCCYCSRARRWSCLSAQMEFTICSQSQRYVALKQTMYEWVTSFVPFPFSFAHSLVRSFSMRCAMRRRRLQLSLSTQPCLVQRPQYRPSWSAPSCVRSYSTLLLCGAFRCPACSSFSVSLPIQHHQAIREFRLFLLCFIRKPDHLLLLVLQNVLC